MSEYNNEFCEIEEAECVKDEKNNFHQHMFIIRTNKTINIGGYQGRLGDLWIQIYN